MRSRHATIELDAAASETGGLQAEVETYRRELTGYCYRMLGSGFEADDAVQETMLRAWKNLDRFEGRSALRSWLYRIATNVCLDMLKGPQRRARPMDLSPSGSAEAVLASPVVESVWVQPVADASVVPIDGDPADIAAARESIRLAFVAALQHLPARQRAVLILREVLRWQATEVAELLDTSVASVNSALQRARATLAQIDVDADRPATIDAGQQALLARYVEAFERYDIPALVALLHQDATFCMPPYSMWLEGPEEVSAWLAGQGVGCRRSRLVATSANGCPAFGSYRRVGPNRYEPFAVQILEVTDGQITAWYNFLGAEQFALLGLPDRLED